MIVSMENMAKPKSGGFTLIEVVVAMAILGVGLVVIIELFSGGLRLGKTSEEYSKAIQYARLKMEEVLENTSLAEGEEEGQFDNDYRWAVAVKKVDLLPQKDADYRPPIDFYQVRVNVFWRSGLRERSTGVETYRTLRVEEEAGRS